jgi:putative ABC transport system permease protein
MLRHSFALLGTSLPLALSALLEWPLRAALTAFGILIGVASVVTTVALGEGTQVAVRKQLASMGENTLNVAPEAVQASVQRQGWQPRLTEADGEAIAREAPSVSGVAPVLTSQAQVSFGGFNVSAEVIGTNQRFLDLRAWSLTSGEKWADQAEKTASRVCLIGQKVKTELFGDADPVGRVLRIGQHPFRVLGVLAEKGPGPFGQDQDAVVLMPIATKRAKLQQIGFGLVQQLILQAKDPSSLDSAKREAGSVLRERHSLWEGAQDDFSIRGQDGFRETQDRVVGILRILLTSVAAISLVVGGIGIMNIMLVSVSERTRDIGIRMAIGASRWDILAQFLTESMLLSLLGGALGAALSLAAVLGLSHALSLPMQPSLPALGAALGVSVGIGLVFGAVPSWRAASLDPVLALGRE